MARFCSRGATGVASVRSCRRLPLCPTEVMPASSNMDLLLANAESISEGGSTSGITYLRRGKKPVQQQLQQERGVRIHERNKVSEEGEGMRCSRRQRRDSSATHCEDHSEPGCHPTAHGGPRWSRDPPASCGGAYAGAGGCT